MTSGIWGAMIGSTEVKSFRDPISPIAKFHVKLWENFEARWFITTSKAKTLLNYNIYAMSGHNKPIITIIAANQWWQSLFLHRLHFKPVPLSPGIGGNNMISKQVFDFFSLITFLWNINRKYLTNFKINVGSSCST